MEEREWLTCSDSMRMLEFLQATSRASERKARLFAVAALRQGWQHQFLNAYGWRAVEVGERYADGLARKAELQEVENEALAFADAMSSGDLALHYAATYSSAAVSRDPVTAFTAAVSRDAAGRVVGDLATIAARLSADRAMECSLLHCIFGPLPFRTFRIDPAWLRWKDATVVRIAQAIYEGRELPSGALDKGQLAILADALEEAGCANTDILRHCRQQRVLHVRGCFVLDLLLGKD